MNRTTAVLLALALLLPVPYAAGQTGEYVIGKGDQLLITVWGFPEFTTSAAVRENGAVSIPLAGEIPADGLRRDEFVSSLKRRLAEYIQGDIAVTVSVLSSSAQRVTVMGAVSRPDAYPLTGETSLLHVLGTAGGPLPGANLTGVQIFRKNRADGALTVNLEDALEQADVDRLPLVRPGDVVVVPHQKNFLKDFGDFLGISVALLALLLLIDRGVD